jgi:hypothetical protein
MSQTTKMIPNHQNIQQKSQIHFIFKGWYIIWIIFSKVRTFKKFQSKIKWENHQPFNWQDPYIIYSYNITILRFLGEVLEKIQFECSPCEEL